MVRGEERIRHDGVDDFPVQGTSEQIGERLMHGENFAAAGEVTVKDGAFCKRLGIGELRAVVNGDSEEID